MPESRSRRQSRRPKKPKRPQMKRRPKPTVRTKSRATRRMTWRAVPDTIAWSNSDFCTVRRAGGHWTHTTCRLANDWLCGRHHEKRASEPYLHSRGLPERIMDLKQLFNCHRAALIDMED